MTNVSDPAADAVGNGGDGDVDAGPLDLTPRTSAASMRRRRRTGPLLVIAVVILSIGVLLVKTLGDASLFFQNADQAVAQRTELGDKRFRMQGTVLADTVVPTEVDGQAGVQFSVAYDGVEVDVVHVGDPPQLFKPDVPVVLEGRWTQGGAPQNVPFSHGVNDGWYFASDRMLVKHDSSYTAKNSERLTQADQGGQVPVAADTISPTAVGGSAK
jgi:cytochrome c-type biogenesis protein CcmE